jgi:hypothetical protein
VISILSRHAVRVFLMAVGPLGDGAAVSVVLVRQRSPRRTWHVRG